LTTFPFPRFPLTFLCVLCASVVKENNSHLIREEDQIMRSKLAIILVADEINKAGGINGR
jgi:hypothetical protein